MSLVIKNLSDGTTQTVDSGGLAFITLHAAAAGAAGGAAASRGLFVQWDAAEWTTEIVLIDTIPVPLTRSGAGGVTVAGDLAAETSYVPILQGDVSLTGTPGEYDHQTPAAFINLNAGAPGVYYVTLVLTGVSGAQYCGMLVRVLPAFNLPLYPALDWIPAGAIDLLFDLGTKVVNSAVLSRMLGLVQGEDFSLAIVPSLAGSIVHDGVTDITLSILPYPGYDGSPLLIKMDGTPLVAVNPSGSNYYFVLTGNLRISALKTWLTNANAAAAKATPGAAGPAILQCQAMLSITDAAGVTTSQAFPFPIQQFV